MVAELKGFDDSSSCYDHLLSSHYDIKSTFRVPERYLFQVTFCGKRMPRPINFFFHFMDTGEQDLTSTSANVNQKLGKRTKRLSSVSP